jgi:hypothetical protein
VDRHGLRPLQPRRLFTIELAVCSTTSIASSSMNSCAGPTNFSSSLTSANSSHLTARQLQSCSTQAKESTPCKCDLTRRKQRRHAQICLQPGPLFSGVGGFVYAHSSKGTDDHQLALQRLDRDDTSDLLDPVEPPVSRARNQSITSSAAAASTL